MFNRLIKNELIKQFKKKGILFLTVFVLALSVVSPVVIKYLDDAARAEVNLSETIYTMEILDQELSKTPTTEAEKVKHLVYTARKNNLLITEQLALETTDWRGQVMEMHLFSSITRELISGLMSGISYEDIKLNAENYDFDLIESLAGASTEELTQSYDEQTALINQYEQVVTDNDYIGGTNLLIWEIDDNIAIKEAMLDDLRAQTQDSKVLSDIEFNELFIEKLEADQEIMQIRIDDQIPYDDNDWKSLTIDRMLFYNSGIYQTVMTESEFYLYGFKDLETYEQYLDITNKKIDGRKDNMAELEHSLVVDLPAYELIVDARSSTYISLEVSVIAITVLLIFMGCGIMSSEFSKGTIRMLVARPVKRQTIFLAKLSSLVVVGIGLVLVSAVLSTMASGLLFDFSDFGIDVAKSVGGVLTSHNFFAFLFSEIIVTLGGMALVISLLITLSTITKSSVLTLGVTMILYMLSATIGAFFIASPIIRYSFIPYMNIGLLRLVPDLYNSIWGMGYDLNLQLGAICMAALAAVISIIGCLVFVKKDIRN